MVAITKLLCVFNSAVAVLTSRSSLSSNSVTLDENSNAVYRDFRHGSANKYHHSKGERNPLSKMAFISSASRHLNKIHIGASSERKGSEFLDDRFRRQSKYRDEPKSISEALGTLNAQFQKSIDAVNAFSEDPKSQGALVHAIEDLYPTLTALEQLGKTPGDEESEAKSAIEKLDDITGTVDKLAGAIRGKSEGWVPNHRYNVVGLLNILLLHLDNANGFVWGINVAYISAAAQKWSEIESVVKIVAIDLARSVSANVIIEDHEDHGVVMNDFLSRLQEGVHDLTSVLKDYKPNDVKKEEAINQPMDKLLTVLGGTLHPSRKQFSPESQKQAFNRLHDLSFAVDDMLDVIFDIKRDDLTPAYRNKLAEDFHNLDVFARLLTGWVEDLANGGNHEVRFWRHIISVFQGAASALSDGEVLLKDLKPEAVGDQRTPSSTVNSKSRNRISTKEKPYTPVEFLSLVDKATKDLTSALQAFTSNDNKEPAISKPLNELASLFFSDNFDRHWLTHAEIQKLDCPFRRVVSDMKDMYRVLLEKLPLFERDHAAWLSGRFEELGEGADRVDNWLFAVVEGDDIMRFWVGVKHVLVDAAAVLRTVGAGEDGSSLM